MQCNADGCSRSATYKAAKLCQKHYFRLRRTGFTDLRERPKRAYRITMPGKGYQRVYEPQHPLRDKGGYVAEHRMVVYARYGESLPPCELCGQELAWRTVHVDHINRNVRDNDPANLRPLCRACNTTRDYPAQHSIGGHSAISFDGETKTATEWARDPRVAVTGATIRRRKLQGMSDAESLFAEKRTHNGKDFPGKAERRYKQMARELRS